MQASISHIAGLFGRTSALARAAAATIGADAYIDPAYALTQDAAEQIGAAMAAQEAPSISGGILGDTQESVDAWHADWTNSADALKAACKIAGVHAPDGIIANYAQ